ncbi:MAG: nucleotidyltransferase domain-containing protein [Planctomycetota bacterium]
MVTMEEIRELADRIAREFRPERIILFGSYAGGRQTSDSDVDLLVILRHAGKSWRLAAEIRGRVHPGYPIDVLVREPQEMRRRVAEGDPFFSDILRKGEVLYESHDG